MSIIVARFVLSKRVIFLPHDCAMNSVINDYQRYPSNQIRLGVESAPGHDNIISQYIKVTRDPSNPSPCDCTCHITYATQSVYSILICHHGSKNPLLVPCDILLTHSMIFEIDVTT